MSKKVHKVKAPKGYKLGRCRKFRQYCRMIRICVASVANGKVLDGINTNTGEKEMCIVFKRNDKDPYESICYDLIKLPQD